MPSKNSKGSAAGRKSNGRGFNAHRFIEYSLTTNDKEVLRAEYSESDFGYGLVEDLIAQGYKFSCSYSDASRCYITTLTDKREGGQFANTSLSGRGSTIANSRVACLYRHYVVAQEDWNIFGSDKDAEPDDFG